MKLRIFGQDGSWTTYTASDKIRIDAVKYTDVNSALTNIQNMDSTYYQAVKYSVNAVGILTELDTTHNGSDENVDTRLDGPYPTTGYFYTATGIFAMKYGTDTDTIMMMIPADKSCEEEYKVITTASLSYGDYTFDAYNPESNNVLDFIVFTDSTQINAMSGNLFLVERVTEGMNANDEPAVCLTGYYKGEKVSYYEAESGILNASAINKGDVLTIALSPAGEISAYKKKFYRDAELGASPVPSDAISESTTETGSFSSKYYCYGTAKANKDNMVLLELTGTAVNNPLLINVNGSEFNVYYHDTQTRESRLGSVSDIMDSESVGTSAASKVVVYLYNWQVKDIVVFD